MEILTLYPLSQGELKGRADSLPDALFSDALAPVMLRALEEAAGDRFHRGVVLYMGTETIPFGENIHALPMRGLWRTGPSTDGSEK